MPISHLKRNFRLCKILCYQIPGFTFQHNINEKLFLQKTKLQAKKLGHLDEKTAKNRYLYVPFSQTLLFNVK